MTALLIACAAPFTFAQTADDYNKYDIGVLYSHNRVDTGVEDPSGNFFNNREGFHGVELTAKGNVSRYVGLKGSYSFNRKSFDINGGTAATTFDTDVNIHQFLGGVELKDNARETKVKPFGHVLAGVAHSRAKVTGTVVSFTESETGFAAAVGGGVDFRINDRVDFRAIQLDWNPVRDNGTTSNNFRIGIGFIFR
jgi:opacity protein-like surface antigen